MPSVHYKHHAVGPSDVTTFTATGNTDASAIDLAWTITTPSGFTSFVLTRDGGALATITNPNQRSYQDATASADTSYTYRIVVHANGMASSGRTTTGSWSSIPPDPGAPDVLTITNSSSGPTLSWDSVDNASTYLVQRAATKTVGSQILPLYEGPWTTLTETAGLTYQDTAGVAGVGYYYRIVPKNASGTTGTPLRTRVGIKNASSSAGSVATSTLTTGATFNSIDIRLDISGDSDGSSVVLVEYKRTSESDWRQALPLHRPLASGAYKTFHAGSIPLLTPGGTYDLRVIIADTGGVSGVAGSEILTTTQATRADTITALHDASGNLIVTPDRYVNASTGSDGNAGTTSGTAWRTYDHAVQAFASATADWVVSFASTGTQRYVMTPTSWTNAAGHSLTIVADKAAVADDQSVINAGNHAILEPIDGYYGRTAAASTSAWTQVTFTGPSTGLSCSAWKWTGGGLATSVNYYNLYYATSATAQPKRVPFWDNKTGSFTASAGTYSGKTFQFYPPSGSGRTYEDWVDLVLHNDSCRFGFAIFGSDVIAILPPEISDPNDYYWWSVALINGTWGALVIGADGSRISGFELRFHGVDSRADNVIVDHNLVYEGNVGTAGDNNVFQYNRLVATGLWSTDSNYPAAPWNWIKSDFIISGQTTQWGRVGASSGNFSNELTALGNNGKRNVFRYCTVDGYFNFWGSITSGTSDLFVNEAADVHDCTITHISDDGLEPEVTAVNHRYWNLLYDHTVTHLSTGPVNGGPLYFFCNRVRNISTTGVGTTPLGARNASPGGFKWSGAAAAGRPKIYVVNNSFHGFDGGGNNAGSGSNTELWYWRNNLVLASRYAMQFPATLFDEDYSHFYTSDATRGVNVNSANKNDIATYRSNTSQGTHSNTASDFHTSISTQVTDATNGDLTLVNGSTLAGLGCPVASIFDLDGITYSGTIDLGYQAPVVGADITAPNAPSNLAGSSQSGSVLITWDASTSDDVRGYSVYRSAVGGGSWSKISGSGLVGVLRYTDSSGTNGATYDYAVTATDYSGNESSRSATLTTGWSDSTAPSAPTSLTATSNIGAIDLAWGASSSSDAAYVRVYRSTSSGGTYTQINTNGATTGTSYRDFPPDGSTYYYKVSAVDGAGNESVLSSAASAAEKVVLFSETWTGADGAAWGANWTTGVEVGGAIDIQSGRGRVGPSGGSFSGGRALASGMSATADMEILVSLRLDEGSGSAQYHFLWARHDGAWKASSYADAQNGYFVYLGAGDGDFNLGKDVSGTQSNLATSTFSYAASTTYYVRFQLQGTTIRARIWASADGSGEPNTWNVSATDSSLASGKIAFSTRTNSGGYQRAARWDDLQIVAP